MKKLNLKTLALLGLSGGLLLGAGSTQNTANTSAQANAKAPAQSLTAGGHTSPGNNSKTDDKKGGEDSSDPRKAKLETSDSKDKEDSAGKKNPDSNSCGSKNGCPASKKAQ